MRKERKKRGRIKKENESKFLKIMKNLFANEHFQYEPQKAQTSRREKNGRAGLTFDFK